MRLIGAIVLALLSIAGLSLDATDAVAAPNPDDFAVNENTGGRIDVSANKGGQPTTAQTPVVKRGVSAPVQPEAPIDCGVVTQDPTARFLDACSVATPQFGTTAPQPTRQQQQASYAVNYFRSLQLPTPAPKISAPAGGVTGAVHSLDLAGCAPQQVVFLLDQSMPFGVRQAVRTSARFTVDWGDGTTDSYYTSAPWPRSTITHSWSRVGRYDVTVTARWTATWTFGDTSGTLSGLTTTGELSNWNVSDAQALIVR